MTQRLSDQEIEELARSYSTYSSAVHLLERAGMSRGRLPAYQGTSREFWWEVAFAVESGVIVDGRARILAHAAADFPVNRVFSAAVPPAGASRGSPRGASRGSAGMPSGPQVVDDLPRPVSLFSLDARGYSKNKLLAQINWRDGLRGILDKAMASTGLVDSAVVLYQDQGDGCLCAIDASVPAATLASDFVRELRIAQNAFNRLGPPENRLRLRMSLHRGDIVPHGSGAAGDAVVVTARILEAQSVRQLLEDHPKADLVLAMSPVFFESTVAERLRDLDPDQFTEISVSVAAKYAGTAWVTLPGYPGNPPRLSAPSPAPAAAGPVRSGAASRARRTASDGPPPYPGRPG